MVGQEHLGRAGVVPYGQFAVGGQVEGAVVGGEGQIILVPQTDLQLVVLASRRQANG